MSPPRYSCRLTRKADADLLSIAAYGNQHWGELQSNRYIDQLLDVLDELTLFPHLGEGLNPPEPVLRRLPVGSHVIFYQVNDVDRTIKITRILHARMDAGRHLDLS